MSETKKSNRKNRKSVESTNNQAKEAVMNTNINFTVKFESNNSAVIVFNPEDTKATVKHSGIMNAVSVLINKANPYYQVMEAGMYLHETLADVRNGIGNDNIGYVTAEKLRELLAAGEVVYRNEITDGSVYRLRSTDGEVIFASELPAPRELEEDEDPYLAPKFVKHNSAAYWLIKNFELLRKAEAKKVNIRVYFRSDKLWETKKQQWELFLAGEFEKLAAMIHLGVQNASTYNTLKHMEAISAKVAANGEEFKSRFTFELRLILSESEEKPIDLNDYIGRKVQFIKGKTAMNITRVVAPDNIESIKAACASIGAKLVLVEDESADDYRNAPQSV